ncbi:MAG: polysaccharide deacetylase family protein, partial [Clostridia bacterium]|nr:polysaccharide deacetylase family protein [Clostridia bacterium]
MKKILVVAFVCVLTSGIAAFSFAGERTTVDTCVDVSRLTKESECLGELRILMYHNTLAPNRKESVYCINQNHLRRDFEYLKTRGYNVVSCDYVIKTVYAGRKLPDKAVILTFDDGYLNNIKYAQPLLEEYSYSALFSVVGDYTKFDRTN